MQWQRVFYGFRGALVHAGRVHSVFEFTVPQFPMQLIRIKVVETPEGQFHAIPDHCVSCDDPSRAPSPSFINSTNPELALREALDGLTQRLSTTTSPRLERVQYW